MISEHPAIKKLEAIISELSGTDNKLQKLDKLSNELQLYIQNKIRESTKTKKGFDINEDGLKEWLKHYWTWEKIPVYHDGKFIRFEIVISIPKVWNESVGWFWKSEQGYNKYKVNSVTNILGLLPEHMRKEIDFPEPLNVKFGGNGSYLKGNDIKTVAKKYPEHIEKLTGDKLYIKKHSYYEIVKELIRNNTNPFDFNPIPENLFEKKKSNVELRIYQKKSLKKFFDYSRILILYPTGAGKTFPALEALNQLKPPHIIFAGKYTTSVQQWKNRIKAYCPELKDDDVDVFTYQGGLTKAFDREYTVGIYDEVHHITGKEWINMTKINVKTVMGLTASPYTETEGGDEMIVALTGIPDMPDWNYFYKHGIVTKPTCHIWLVKNETEKTKILSKLLEKKIKTLIFCDGLDKGNEIAKKFHAPFISGSTKPQDRLDIVNSNLTTFASRVFDESASVPDLERTIEFEYMGKSRTQELQRAGRGLHNQDKTKTPLHHVIMTYSDFEKDKGRLIVLSEKEFNVNWHYDQTELNKASAIGKKPERKQKEKSIKIQVESKPLEINEDDYPLTKNNRVKKILSKLTKVQATIFLPFLKRDRTENGWTVRELMDEFGILDSTGVYHKIKIIVAKKYIIKKGDRFVQNITN